MKKHFGVVVTAAAVIAALAGIAYAQVADPIAVRKGIMQSNAASIGVVNNMLAAGATYDATAAMAALTTIAGNMVRFPMLFPEGTAQGEAAVATRALPAIWQNMADFQAKAAELSAAAATAANAAADGPQALQAALAAVTPVCGACHSAYRGPAP